ncbi:unnamed protein product [Polarella glacialis]|uniref:Uncharacterized protein n=1 Tax=Polarella glacialis TaxID=89957 RepID=A0A813I948_POLGL|nr:unnamed protein product [Polarella glacialis]
MFCLLVHFHRSSFCLPKAVEHASSEPNPSVVRVVLLCCCSCCSCCCCCCYCFCCCCSCCCCCSAAYGAKAEEKLNRVQGTLRDTWASFQAAMPCMSRASVP